MLQSMRHLAQTPVVKTLMLLLIVSFSIWGIGDIFRGNSLHRTVAKAGNTEISVQELMQAFDQELAHARQTMDPNLTAQQAKQIGLLDQTLDSLIRRALVDQDVKKLGIDVTPQAVLQVVADQPQFRNKDGSFNKVLFRQLLQQQGVSEGTFLAQSQDDMARQQLLNALIGLGTVPQTIVDAVYKARAQKRILDVVTVDGAKMASGSAPNDAMLKDYYTTHAKEFTAPEYRAITIAALSTDNLMKDISISDADLKKAYEDKKSQLAHGEKRDLMQVVVQDEAKAQALAKEAKADGDLSLAAKKAGDVAVPLEGMEAGNLMPELSKPVFAAAQGSVLDPIKTQLGWHVVQVKKIEPAGTPDFASIKERLRSEMERDMAVESATRTVNTLDDELAAGHSLDDIADELKLRLIKIPAVTAAGLTPDGKKPPELPAQELVLRDAFAQNAGDSSPVEDDRQGNYYVVRTDDVTPSSVKPFEAVRDEVIAGWKRHAEEAQAAVLAAKIEQGLKDGKPLSGFAGEAGVTVRQSSPISQIGDNDANLPPALVGKALLLKKGETATGSDSAGHQVAVRIASISDADMSKDDPRRGRIVGELKDSASQELMQQYLAHIYDELGVKINTERLADLRQQDQ